MRNIIAGDACRPGSTGKSGAMSNDTGAHALPRIGDSRAAVPRPRLRLLLLALLLVTGSLAASACGSNVEVKVEESYDVTLGDWYIAIGPGMALPGMTVYGAGRATFNVYNDSETPHQFIVVKLSTVEMPTTEDGSVDLGAEGVNVIGRTLEIAPGDTESALYTLDIGEYGLMCNLVDDKDGQKESHYQRGMHAGFNVQDRNSGEWW